MTVRLITIPISHYCEKARWALERASVSYQEEPHLQVFHYLPALREGRSATVPVLVHPGGVLTDSTDILLWVDAHFGGRPRLYPEHLRERIQQLETHYDEQLGPAGRLLMYQLVLSQKELVAQYAGYGIPPWQRFALGARAFKLVGAVIRKRLGVSAEAAEQAQQLCERVFDGVADLLEDGRPFLVGDAFSAADITFAALAAPLVLPSNYGVPLPNEHELPDDYRRRVELFRKHPAGAFVLRMFREQRNLVTTEFVD